MDKKIEVEDNEDFLEIKFGDLYMKVPKDLPSVILAISFLETYEGLLKKIPSLELSQELESHEIKNEVLINKKEEESPQEIGVDTESDEKVVEIEIPEPPEEIEEGIPEECPQCKSKVKTSRVKTRNNKMFQIVKCKKNWLFGKCDFKKEYAFEI